MRSFRAQVRRGMTLIEMMIAMVVFSIVMAGAVLLLRSESRAFALGSERVAMYQNGRFAINEMEKDLRTSGSGAPDVQPQVLYAADSVVAFNANYWTNTAGDVEAVYYNPDAPDSAVVALQKASAITIPYSTIQYPDTNYLTAGVNSSAETIIFYFERDTTTARTDDFALLRKVNNLPAEVVSPNILRTSGSPFFEYFRLVTSASGTSSLVAIPADTLPLHHSVPIHLASSDTGLAARIDSIRAVRVSFTVSNGKAGAEERLRTIERLIRLPNVGLVNTKTCGDEPIFSVTPTAANAFAADGVTPVVNVTFTASTDETSGEMDVERYVIWRRLSAAAEWGDPYVTLPGGASPYQFTDGSITPGETYVYAVAAQDCTPSLSVQRSTGSVTVPLPVIIP